MLHPLKRAVCPLLLILLSVTRLEAQAPNITPAGDPSVVSDTIYRLAVDPAAHPEENVAWLLDDGVLRLERDGTGSKTYRIVAQILKQAAVESYAEHTFSYDAAREEFVLNWFRVVTPEGTVVSEKPLHVQELDAPVPEAAPIYSQVKRVRVSAANVAPGRIVDYSYTLRVKDPVMKGHYSSAWRITTGGTVRRSRLIIDLPADAKPHIVETNLDFRPQVTEKDGRITRVWFRADMERLQPELFASDSNAVEQFINVSGETEWADIARWYSELSRDRFAPAPEVVAKLAEIVQGARTRLDSLRAVHRWLAQDVRYVSLSLGLGGYQPRLPAEVIRTSAGDCKDKTTLFVAMARMLGYEAYPVLVNSSVPLELRLPSIEQFDHVIAAVRLDGRWHFTDLTSEIVPFDHTAPVAFMDHGLLVRDDGSSELLAFEQPRPDQHRSVVRLTATLEATGQLSGLFERIVSGMSEHELRRLFPDSLSTEEREQVMAAIAAAVIPTAVGDSIDVLRGRDLQSPPRLRVWLHSDGVLKPAAQGWVFMLPIEKYANPQLIGTLQREKTRLFTFEAAELVGPREIGTELEVTLPEGWKAELPQSVVARSEFGTYEASYTQEGRVLKVRRALSGRRKVLPVTAKAELITWLREIARDDIDFVTLHPAGN